MIDGRFPNWDIDVEKGTIYSLYYKRYIGTINEKDNYIKVYPPKGYKHRNLHQYIWMVANGCDIPEGYDIHHVDGDKNNNSIYNLELIEHKEHVSEHKKGMTFSEEYIRKLSESHKGKHHTDNTKKKISESNKGKIVSEETKLKISKSQINDLKKSKKVAQYTLDGELIKIWDSANECGRNGFSQGSVSACCRGELKSSKGYIWKYYNEERDVA